MKNQALHRTDFNTQHCLYVQFLFTHVLIQTEKKVCLIHGYLTGSFNTNL